MGLLRRKSPIEQLENEVGGLRSRRAVLADRLARADVDIERALADRRRQLVETDSDEGDVEPTRVGQLRDTRASFADAIGALDIKIAEAVARLDEARDRARREVAVRELGVAVDSLAKLADDFGAVAGKLPDALASVLDRLPVPPVSKTHVQGFVGAVIEALQLAVRSRSHASQITAGVGSICEPSPQLATPPPPPVERLKIFPLQPSKWSEADGSVVTTGRHTTISPPVSIARAALANGTALDPFCDNAIVLRQRIPPDYSCYAEADCIDLAEPKPAKLVGTPTAAPPVIHSEFTRARGGTATVMRNPR
jgi:hypothetical protein